MELENGIIASEYQIKADYFTRKYAEVASSCQDVATMLKQVVEACGRMEALVDNEFICVAVNAAIQQQDIAMEALVFDATGLAFQKGRWVNWSGED